MDPTKKIIEKAKRLSELRDMKEKLETELKEVNKEKGFLEENVLPQMMEEYEIEKMSIDGVGTLYTQHGVYAYVHAEDKERANQWFKENGHGDIVKETVHPATLKSFVKERMEEGNPVPDFFNAKPITYARIRRK